MTPEEVKKLAREAYREMQGEFTEESHEGAETVFKSEVTTEDYAVGGMVLAQEMVAAFHEKMGLERQRLCDLPETLSDSLEFAAAQLSAMSEHLLSVSHDDDRRLGRAGKLAEELSELFSAMAERDEVAALDALADLEYVLRGTAVTLDLPLPRAFAEVHRANMTKERQADDGDGDAVRGRGPSFRPADLARVLYVHRGGPTEEPKWPVNPCAELREKIKDPPMPVNTYGDAPDRHSPHVMGVLHGGPACVNCGMPEVSILVQRQKTGRAKCNGTAGVHGRDEP